MAEFSLTVVASVRGYHTYMDQWEAEIDSALFFERELGEYDTIEGVRDCIRCFVDQFCRAGKAFAADWYCFCNTISIVKSKKNKDRGVW